jgi:hypothetical protein
MPGRHTSLWHQQVGATIAGQLDFDVGSDEIQIFPFAQLQAHTDEYLKKKGRLTPDGRDARLIALIKDHSAKDVAIVACAHALSPQAVRDLFRGELHVDPRNHLSVLVYLRAVVRVNHANRDAVTGLEAQCAQALIKLASPDVIHIREQLHIFAVRMTALMKAGAPGNPLLHHVVDGILRSACTNFGAQMEAMQFEMKWLQAHAAANWLSTLPGPSPNIGRLLDDVFPNWRIWAAWRPDINCLRLWENLTAEQRQELRDILSLEGPDFISGGKATLREGLLSQPAVRSGSSVSYGRLVIKLGNGSDDDARTMLDRLVNAFTAACSASLDSLALFTHICVHNAVDSPKLQILEHVNAISDPSVSKGVRELLSSRANSVRAAGLMQLLPALDGDRGQALREALSTYVVGIMEEVILGLQDKFCSHLQSGLTVDGAGMRLHEFGMSLRNASWLEDMINGQLRSLLRGWPATKDVTALLKLRADAQSTPQDGDSSLTDMIDAYCVACLTGRGTCSVATRNIVERLIHMWQQPPDSDRREVALEIARRSNIPFGIRRQCLVQLSDMTEKFIRSIRPIVNKDTDIACVHFARLLVAQKLLNTDRIASWRDLLLYMVEQRSSTLLEYTLKHLDVKSWLQWLDHLRKIFHNLVGHSSLPILKSSLHHWAERLSVNYLSVLPSLELANESGSLMRWILTGWEESDMIIPLLNLLKDPQPGPCQTAIKPMMALLAPDGSNIRQVCVALSLLTRTTTLGTQACLRVLELHQRTPKQVVEALSVAWFQASEVNSIGKRALQAIADVLGISINTRGNLPATTLQAATAYLDGEYATVITEAARLESMRLTLKIHDPQKTSTLLERLSIEDTSAIEHDISGIPESLIDVVDRIGDGLFELCFPLTHLKPLQRAALGVGKCRMVLVRVMLGNGSTPPEFCIHLHPELGGDRSLGVGRATNPSTVGHYYWQASQGSSAPDTHFCRGRANRVTYQLGRALWRHLMTGLVSLDSVHRTLASELENLAQNCIICGTPIGARLWRSTGCQAHCSVMLRKSNLEVRLADLRLDPNVVDLLLTMAHAAAVAGDVELLPGCPIGNMSSVIQTLNSLPSVASLQSSHDLNTSVKQLGASSEKLLSWICTSYRGFLASATGALKIPSMPGVHQFVLASAAPELEKAFAVNMRSTQPPTVVFHGTTVDRLYRILCQGLHIGGGTKWARHGASYGNGIYVAEDPATSLGYTSGHSGSSSGWRASIFQNVRVVLGCELIGASDFTSPTRGIYVVKIPSRLMVRYIFLFSASAAAPAAQHVTPALLSAFASLRKGSV